MMVHATDQISADLPWPDCLMTSGAIQYGVPLIERAAPFDSAALNTLVCAKCANDANQSTLMHLIIVAGQCTEFCNSLIG
jgi:hypothetical protein